jgi:anti-anti-sigma regulatory factor
VNPAVAPVVDFDDRVDSFGSQAEGVLVQAMRQVKKIGDRPFYSGTHIVQPEAAAASGKEFVKSGHE